MKKVITYGTFDLFHIGHLNLLEKAHSLGNFLIVAVSSDKFNLEKGKTSVINYEQRKRIVEAIKCVDLVIPENSWDQKIRDVKTYNIDTFIIGDDWIGEFDFLKSVCEVIYVPRTPVISTTQIKIDIMKEE